MYLVSIKSNTHTYIFFQLKLISFMMQHLTMVHLVCVNKQEMLVLCKNYSNYFYSGT